MRDTTPNPNALETKADNIEHLNIERLSNFQLSHSAVKDTFHPVDIVS